MAELLQIINEILDDAGRAMVTTVEPGTRLREDLEFDSIELAVLTVKIEAAYGVDVFRSGIVNTIGEIQEKLPTAG